ncbi:MAG: hypothetical protein LBQ88_09765 [Treponema sp.]|jgi:hypothetical protein|nr:hypothetical protein [Treponema sp.]
MGTPKKGPERPKIVLVGSRIASKGNSTRKAKKPRSTRRYFEVKIRIPTEDFVRGQSYFHEEKYLSRYVLDAYLEKVNRAEANDKKARIKKLLTDEDLLLSVLTHMQETGKLKPIGIKDLG